MKWPCHSLENMKHKEGKKTFIKMIIRPWVYDFVHDTQDHINAINSLINF